MGEVVTIPYKPRELQKKLHKRLARFNVLVCHRRFGKTVFSINEMIRLVLSCKRERPRVAYICPLFKQAKNVAWDMVKHYSRVIPGVVFNEAELRADYPNGGRLQLYGADNADALRGIYLDGVVLDEYAQINPRAWSEVIRPALSDRKGSAIFIGTPQGHNSFYDLFKRADVMDNWHREMYKASETGLLDDEELNAMRMEMTEAEYEQELECSWSAAIRGAYYAKAMDEAKIMSVPYDPAIGVITTWDLGVSDATVIWFLQIAGAEIRAINCLSFQGSGLDAIVKKLNELPYSYTHHIVPHDIKVRELGTGKTRLETLASLGVRGKVAPNQSIADGIAATRAIIPRMVFDEEKCKQGIEALRQYRTEYDDKRQVFRSNPLHDWCSDFADSLRYFAISKDITYNGSEFDDFSVSVNG